MMQHKKTLAWDPLQDIKAIQNPALGAVLVWQFCLGFVEKSQQLPNFLHPFVVLPIVWNPVSFEALISTRKDSGLIALASKLITPTAVIQESSSLAQLPKSGIENLYAIHGRAVRFRALTLKSLLLAIEMGLLTLDSKNGNLVPKEISIPQKMLVPIKKLVQNSFKLGMMCAAKSPSQIGKILQVQY